MLDELYKTDPDKSKKLVQRTLKTWNETSIYKLAVDADLMAFKTHDTFQAYLDKMWRGHIPAEFKVWQVGLYVLILVINRLAKVRLIFRETLLAFS